MDFENNILPSSLDDDTLSPSEIAEKIEKMRQLKAIIKKYEEQIKTRKDGRQYYVIINRKQITAITKESLYEKLWQMEYGRSKSSLKDLFPEWLIWKRDYTSTTNKTLKEYKYLWDALLQDDDIVSVPMKNLAVKDFTNFFRKLTKGRQLTKKRFTNLKSLLNGIYDYAIEEEIVSCNPIRDVNCKQLTFKPVNHSNEAFSIEEREKLLTYLQTVDNIYSYAIQLDFCLVLRIGELLALKWSDIENDMIHIQGQSLIDMKMNDDLSFTPKEHINVNHIKGNTDQGFRYEPLTPKALFILEKIRKLNPAGEYILMKDGKQITYDSFNRNLKNYCINAGIKPRSSHKIRFTTASMLFNDGMPLTNLQNLLGHTTPAMTMHYIRSVTPAETTTQIMASALG